MRAPKESHGRYSEMDARNPMSLSRAASCWKRTFASTEATLAISKTVNPFLHNHEALPILEPFADLGGVEGSCSVRYVLDRAEKPASCVKVGQFST